MPPKVELTVDWAGLARELTDIVYGGIRGLVEAGHEDLVRYAQGIARNIVDAAQLEPARRDQCIAELLGQLETLAEIQRIRAEAAAWETVRRVVFTAAQALIKGLTFVKP